MVSVGSNPICWFEVRWVFLVDLGLCRMILIKLVTLLLAEQVQSSRFLEGYKWVQN